MATPKAQAQGLDPGKTAPGTQGTGGTVPRVDLLKEQRAGPKLWEDQILWARLRRKWSLEKAKVSMVVEALLSFSS